MLIFSYRDLKNFGLQVVHPSLYLLQVILHPFTLAFVIPIYLVYDDLGVPMNDHTYSPAALARSSPAIRVSYSISLLVVGKSR